LERLSTIRDKLRGLTIREVVAEALLRASRNSRRFLARATDDPDKTFVTDAELERSLGAPVGDVAQRLRDRAAPHLTVGLGDLDGTVELIKQFYPDSVEEARRTADPILNHRVTIFERQFDLGPLIDWKADPATGLRWPFEHYTRTPLILRAGSDVRVIWELNRLHQFVTLGRAYALTADERYTEEFLLQLASWYEENPPRFGVNWTVAMEAAIRAVNLIAALELFRASPLLDDNAFALALRTLLAHGHFIRANLEFSNRAASNHYLSDLIGLFAIGMTVPDYEESAGWVSFSAPRLLEEMKRQVMADGVSYEGSVAYHRLVLEIYTLFFSLAQANGIELDGQHWERLEAMFDFTRHYLKPDGTAPLVGDSDDGRLLKFKQRPAIDHSYLISMAAVLLENEKFKESSRLDEEALWWFGQTGRDGFESLRTCAEPPVSRAFDQAQIYIQRQGPLYAIIDCGDHGIGGRGSHAHSDALSLELFAYDHTFLRDPGTFVYTASDRWRNLFRSTAYHNTVRLDGQEISQIIDGQLFALGPNVRPRVIGWDCNQEMDLIEAEHYGYCDLPQGVIHRRDVTFNKTDGYWIVEDTFEGEGAHLFEFFFNFDPGLEVKVADDLSVVASGQGSALSIAPVSGLAFEAEITTRWVAPSYGTRVRSSGIIYRLRREVPFSSSMLLIPYRNGDEAKIERVREAGKKG
jgi:heparinase II/III-like protein